jgi:hypothetical protein
MANIEQQLKRYLFRAFCPDSTELGEYALNILERSEAQTIQQHLKDCPHCQREVSQLKTYLEDLSADLDLSLVERINVWVGKLVSLSGPQAPAFAHALRGEGEKVLLYQAGDAQVSLQFRTNQLDPKLQDVYGLVIGIVPSDWRAILWQEGRQAAVSEVDELSSFSLSGIQPGSFTLILTSPENEIHIEVDESQS